MKINILLPYTEEKKNWTLPEGQTLLDGMKNHMENYRQYMGAIVSNELVNLGYTPKDGDSIRLLDIKTTAGMRIYTNTLVMIFQMAQERLFPERRSIIHHHLGSAIYTETQNKIPFRYADVNAIEEEMRRIIKEDMPILKETIQNGDLLHLFEKEQRADKVKLYKTIDKTETTVYRVGEHMESFEGEVAPSTGFVDKFALKYYYPGILIPYPSKKKNYALDLEEEHPKLSKVFQDATKAAEIVGVSYVGDLNDIIRRGKARELILVSETFLDNKMDTIAKEIIADPAKRVVLISGPSSSGKTTFAQKLKVHLKISGVNTIEISTDDYFVRRSETPLKPDGSYDFETIDAVDIKSLNRDIMGLIEEGSIQRRSFDFIKGEPIFTDEVLHLGEKDIIIIEGIHALNPKLSRHIPNRNKFKIYLSALTTMNIDHSNRVSTTDARFIRRMVRDNRTRGRNVITSITEWKNVREGEDKYVFPFQEEAEILVDTSLDYELAVLKKHAMPLLKQVPKDSPHYVRAKRLMNMLEYFNSIEDDELLPNTSLLKEFIGGSVFDREIEL
ncbi:MAG: nucleoside kinase [Tissierellia bacterium]|nr:nucleoside kinase [Tissierellia bacterium]